MSVTIASNAIAALYPHAMVWVPWSMILIFEVLKRAMSNLLVQAGASRRQL